VVELAPSQLKKKETVSVVLNKQVPSVKAHVEDAAPVKKGGVMSRISRLGESRTPAAATQPTPVVKVAPAPKAKAAPTAARPSATAFFDDPPPRGYPFSPYYLEARFHFVENPWYLAPWSLDPLHPRQHLQCLRSQMAI